MDAVPICLGTRDEREIVRTVEVLEPTFGGINLEDIAQPKCFRVLDALRARLGIPVWHDDQQGTATVTFAALLNALEVVGKRLAAARIVLVDLGAANFAVYRILVAAARSSPATAEERFTAVARTSTLDATTSRRSVGVDPQRPRSDARVDARKAHPERSRMRAGGVGRRRVP